MAQRAGDLWDQPVLGFRIEGQLWSQPIPLEIYMRTEIDLESGLTQVVEQKAP